MLFASSMSFGSFRLARHLTGQVVRTFSVWGSVGGCLWPQHVLSLQHLSQERIDIVGAVAAALDILADAAKAEEGLQRHKPRAKLFSLILKLFSCFMLWHMQLRSQLAPPQSLPTLHNV